MAGDAATNAAARVRPSQEDLAQIDHPAEDNTWHDAPDFSKQSMRDKFHTYYKGNPKEDVKAGASEGTSAAHPEGSSDPRDLATTAARDNQTGASSGVNATGGAVAAKDAVKRNLNENVDDETKDKARARRDEYRERTKNYFSRKVPQERRDQTVWRLKVMSTPVRPCGQRLTLAAENGSRVPAAP
jgi:hypothetical protein